MVGVALVGTALEGQVKKETEGAVRERWEWFYNQRAYPTGRIPKDARLNAVQQAGRVRQLAPSAAGSATVWSLLGPKPTLGDVDSGPVSGRVTALAVHPTNSNIAYLGAADGGVWKTTDGGANWTPLTDGQASLAIGALAIDPLNPNTVYAGTGELNFNLDSVFGVGILKTTDGGANWTLIPGPFAGPLNSSLGGYVIGGLAVHPTNTNILLAAASGSLQSRSGIFRSADGGLTWTSNPVLAGAPGTAVVFNPSNGSIAYAALGDNFGAVANGVYRSTDGGLTWSPRNGSGVNSLPLANAGRISVAIAPSNPQVLFAGIHDTMDNTLLGLFKTTDGGGNWVQLAVPNYCSTQCWYDNVIAVSPANANVVFVAGVGEFSGTPLPYLQSVLRSMDGGASWQQVAVSADGFALHVDQHALAFSADGGKLYDGNDGGVWSTTNVTSAPANVQWTNLNNTLAITQFYPGIALHPTDANVVLGGTQDNGTQMRKTSGITFTETPTCGDGAWAAIDQQTPTNMQVNCNGIDISRTTDGGLTWHPALTGINQNDTAQFIPPLVNDPSNGLKVYFGTTKVYQSVNGGANWTNISGNLSSSTVSLSAISVAPSDSNTVWATTENGRVYVTHNAGAGSGAIGTWANVTSNLPDRYFTNIKISAGNANQAYLTVSGFSVAGDPSGHVYVTVNGGSSWSDISGNLPNAPANDIVIDPDIAGTLYVATDVGVFKSTNNGGSWTALGTGLPTVTAVGLKLQRASRKLRVATHGRGVWEIDVPLGTAGVQVTVNTSPSGLLVSMDGGTQAAGPQMRTWGAGEAHTIACVSPQVVQGVSSGFLNWTDGPAVNPRVITVPGANTTYTCTFLATACLYGLSRTNNEAPASGDLGRVDVSTSAGGCGWTATSAVDWITVQPSTLGGTGNGTVRYLVAANTGGPRTGTLQIGGQTLSVTQAAAGCVFTTNPASLSAASGGGTGSVAVSGGGGCVFAAASSASWLTFPNGSTGAAGGTLNLAAAANNGTLPRTASVNVGGQMVQVAQKPPNPSQVFADVSLTHPYVDQITLLKTNGITVGCSATTYCPDATTTRGQMAVFIIRAVSGGDTFSFTSTPYFTDVGTSHPYFKYIQKMKDLGITQGCSATTYCPDDPVTRGQMAVFLIRGRLAVAAGDVFPYTTGQFFTDVPTSHPYFSFIQKLRELGVTVGCSATTYCPDDPTTRGQMAVFIIRAFFTP